MWESVYYIQHEMSFGWLLCAACIISWPTMVVLLVLHLMQVVIDGGAEALWGEFNFWLGLILMKIVLGLAPYRLLVTVGPTRLLVH